MKKSFPRNGIQSPDKREQSCSFSLNRVLIGWLFVIFRDLSLHQKCMSNKIARKSKIFWLEQTKANLTSGAESGTFSGKYETPSSRVFKRTRTTLVRVFLIVSSDTGRLCLPRVPEAFHSRIPVQVPWIGFARKW